MQGDEIEPQIDSFSKADLIRTMPATEPQLEIWLACMMGGEDANRSYNESVLLRLSGKLNLPGLHAALQQLLERQEILRSSFSADGKITCVYKELPWELFYEDISGRELIDKEAELANFSRKHASIVFDLLNGILFRFALLRLSEEEHYLQFTVHHIICDNWSLQTLLRETGSLYTAQIQSKQPQLPEYFSFSQYSLEQQAFLQTKKYQQIVRYWVDQFRNYKPVSAIPTDNNRLAPRSYCSARKDIALPESLVAGLNKLAVLANCNFEQTIFCAFEWYLHLITGHKELVLGLTIPGQKAVGMENLAGHCLDLLPMLSVLEEGEQAFLPYLIARDKHIKQDLEHRPFTVGSLLKKLSIPRYAASQALVPVLFNYNISEVPEIIFDELDCEKIPTQRTFENFEIYLNINGTARKPVLEWAYNTQLFSEERILSMMQNFTILLEAVIHNPYAGLADISFSSASDIAEKLLSWNNTVSVYPRDSLLQELFYKMAATYGSKTALVFENEHYSYQQLNCLSNQLADALIKFGIQPGAVVGLAVDRSPNMLICLLGILKAGAAYLPLDPDYPRSRIEWMLADAQVTCLLSEYKYQGIFNTDARVLMVEDIWRNLSSYAKEDRTITGDSQQLAYVLYTSGSTGKPKGVQISHRNLVNFLWSMQQRPGMQPSDHLLAITSISFDIAALELWLPLITGASLELVSGPTTKDGRLLLEKINTGSFTIMQATPASWRMILEAGWQKQMPIKILCGGEALSGDLADKLLEKATAVWNMYGPTETTVWSAIKEIKADDAIISIGRPINNTQIYILDSKLRPLPEGSIGEIYIGGDGVSAGYLGQLELTEQKFLSNPFSNNGKLYRTGDVGKFLMGGELQCLGRIDQQVKIHGYRIELEEIETELNLLETIQQAVVIARQERLVAYVVPNKDLLTVPQIEGNIYPIDGGLYLHIQYWKKALINLLPAYMVPADFILLKLLPLTPNKKIDRRALPDPVKHLLPQNNNNGRPISATEQMVKSIWEKQLGLQQIGLDDNFFELGGHSLVAVQVMTRLEKQTGKRLPLASLFEAPTIQKLAALVEQNEKKNAFDSLVAIKPGGDKIPLYIVHGFGMNVLLFNNIAKYMDPAQPVYALQAKGLNDPDANDGPETMEAIAAYYVGEMLRQNPKGPYALAGYSLGGIIVFEMAKQLRAMGKQIPMLAMFDSYADNSNYFNPFLLNITRKFRRQFPKMLFIGQSFLRQPLETMQYQAKFLKNRLQEILGKPKNYEAEGQEYNAKLVAKYDYAYSNYKMTPYDGEIDLFKVTTRLYYLDDLIYLGWKPFAKKGVQVYEISGDHRTFLYPPNDKAFAQMLQNALNNRVDQMENIQTVPVAQLI